MNHKLFPFVAAACLTFFVLQPAFGQNIGNSFGGIGVTGTGEVSAKPDTVEVKLRVSGAAELTDDAIVKHRDARDRVMKAFEALKLDNLKVDETNLSVHSGTSKDQAQMIIRGMPQNNTTPAQVEVSSSVRVRLSGIDKMSADDLMKIVGKLLDTAKDSGAAVGPTDEEVSMAYRYGRTTSNSMVRFVVTGAEKIRETAYQKAVDDARQRAERLAKLHELKLGPVLSVQETFVSGDNPNNNNNRQPWEDESSDAAPHGEIGSDSMNSAVFQVKLGVRFEIEGSDKLKTASTPLPSERISDAQK
jgi:uncharacterized protein YggE